MWPYDKRILERYITLKRKDNKDLTSRKALKEAKAKIRPDLLKLQQELQQNEAQKLKKEVKLKGFINIESDIKTKEQLKALDHMIKSTT